MSLFKTTFKKAFLVFFPGALTARNAKREVDKGKLLLEETKKRFGIDKDQKQMSFGFWMAHHKFTGEDIEKSYKAFAVSAYIAMVIMGVGFFYTFGQISLSGFSIKTIPYLTVDCVFATVYWSFLYKCKTLKDFEFPKSGLSVFKKLSDIVPELNPPLKKKFDRVYGKSSFKVVGSKNTGGSSFLKK